MTAFYKTKSDNPFGDNSKNVQTIKNNFIPVAVDSVYPGNSAEVEFFKKITYNANVFTYMTAGGKVLGSNPGHLGDADKALAAFKKLPEAERKPKVDKPAKVTLDQAPPTPQAAGLRLLAYCTYLDRSAKGELSRAKDYYEWQSMVHLPQAMTACEAIWLTEAECKSLIPAQPRKGDKFALPAAVQRPLLNLAANAFQFDSVFGDGKDAPIRSAELTLTVTEVTTSGIGLTLEGFAKAGSSFEDYKASPGSFATNGVPKAFEAKRGCDVQLLGYLHYDKQKKAFDRFDIISVGECWGMLTHIIRGGYTLKDQDWQVKHEPRRWPVGVAIELVSGNRPVDRLWPQSSCGCSDFAPKGK